MYKFYTHRNMTFLVILCILLALWPTPAHAQTAAERAADMLASMTLDEKIGQMTLVEKGSITPDEVARYFIGGVLSGGGGYPSATTNTAQAWAEMVDGYQRAALGTRTGVPMIYGVDAVHGHAAVKGATVFPHNIGLGAADDPALTEQIARATALEMIATGIYWNYAPVAAVVQDPRWGRTYEAFGADTGWVSRHVVAAVKGYHTKAFGSPLSVLATVKHYVGDGGTGFGTARNEDYLLDQGVTEGDESTLRKIHLPPFQEAIEAEAYSVMVSFSSWGGKKMHAQKYLITDVLKTELKFNGFVVSDWGGIDQISSDYAVAVVTSINAGVDMNMVPYDFRKFITTMKAAIASGDIAMTRIDDAVLRILTVKYAMGLFEHPLSDPSLLKTVGSSDHRALAREAVRKSAVLVKNEGVLPLKRGQELLVGGKGADDIGLQSGGWTLEWQGITGNGIPGTSILAGIKLIGGEETNVTYNQYARFAAVDAAGKGARIGIVVVAEPPYAEGRGDVATLELPSATLPMVERMREKADKVVLIILSGRPLPLGAIESSVDAIILGWLPGSEGAGIADLLFGDAEFTGKSPFALD